MGSSEDRRGKVDHDNPPFSRLFVVCSKNHDDDDIKEAFGKYGNLQDVWVVKDRTTHESKGIAYIKYEKASEAHLAMEKLHCERIGGDQKALKVLLADSKGQSRNSGGGDTKPRTRIFILIPKTMKGTELEEEFSSFGTVDSVQILTDKSTGEPKGCAYVKFEKPTSAFSALEECDEKYRAVIAEPRVPRNMQPQGGTSDRGSDSYGGGGGGGGGRSSHDSHRRYPSYNSENAPTTLETLSFTDITDPGAMQRLYIVCHTSLYEEQLHSLFDLVPGLDNFELKMYRGSSESRGFAYATYRTLDLACYAKRKLDGLEYPPGHKLIVKYAEQRPGREGMDQHMDYTASRGQQDWNAAASRPISFTPATGQVQAVQMLPGNGQLGQVQMQQQQQQQGNECSYTDISLPKPQPLAAPGTPCRAKLFLVSTPNAPEEHALRDVFCRFSSLIDIKLLPGTSYGYIRYGMKESAEAAKMVMNNATIGGCTVRLSHQEDGASENKRPRSSFDGGAVW